MNSSRVCRKKTHRENCDNSWKKSKEIPLHNNSKCFSVKLSYPLTHQLEWLQTFCLNSLSISSILLSHHDITSWARLNRQKVVNVITLFSLAQSCSVGIGKENKKKICCYCCWAKFTFSTRRNEAMRVEREEKKETRLVRSLFSPANFDMGLTFNFQEGKRMRGRFARTFSQLVKCQFECWKSSDHFSLISTWFRKTASDAKVIFGQLEGNKREGNRKSNVVSIRIHKQAQHTSSTGERHCWP